MTVPWWNRMSRRGSVIEGVDYATREGPWFVIERVRMPGDPPPMTFTVTKVTYPKKRAKDPLTAQRGRPPWRA